MTTWRRNSGPSYNREQQSSVETSCGITVRTKKSCEIVGPGGSPQCRALHVSVRSLWLLATIKGARATLKGRMENGSTAKARNQNYEVTLDVGCQACNGRKHFSAAGLPWWIAPLLLKSLERLKAVGTSITWRLGLQTIGTFTGTANYVSRESHMRNIRELERLLAIGKRTGDE